MKDIKKFKPIKNSRYHNGVIRPEACHKLYESQQMKPVIYRSGWEKKFIFWLETNPKVSEWGSEMVVIDYVGPDGQDHHYWPDFVVTMNDGSVYIFEVKPASQTKPPKAGASDAVKKTYATNMCKWRAAVAFCEKHKCKFKILTEDTINRLM